MKAKGRFVNRHMNKEAELKKTQSHTKRIVAQYDPEKIILFGSYAWCKLNKIVIL